MTPFAPKIQLGDDVAQVGQILSDTEDYSLVSIEPKRDENFLVVIPFGNNTISGHGEVTIPPAAEDDPMSKACGSFKSGWANDLNHFQAKRFSCHLQGCPECFRIWARRQAESAAGYLWAFVEQYERHIAHWVLSPSENVIRELGDDPATVWKALDDQVRAIINKFGDFNQTVVAIIRHPMRKKCPICGSASEDKTRCVACEVDLVWQWSPHLHVNSDFHFDYARAVEYAGYELDHQIIFSQVSVPQTKEDLADVIAYELGHALFVEGESRQAIRYLGFSVKTHFRSEKISVKSDVGEPEVALDGAVVNHTFYKIQDQCVEEIKPGIMRVRKHKGTYPLARDFYGALIPLQKTTWYYKLTPLGQWVHGRWLRTALPRKLPVPACRKPVFTPDWETKFLNLPMNVASPRNSPQN